MTDNERYFSAARMQMVDGQIRPNNLSDERIIAAMRTIRRERFCPAGLAGQAYADRDLPLGGGRVMPAPLTIARLVYHAAPRVGEKVLVIGANTGYGAAIIGSCGAEVFALEADEGIRAIAKEALLAEAPEIRLLSGPLSRGAPDHAPFALIIIEGAVDSLPGSLADQLAPGGRLITILREDGVGRVVRAEPGGSGFAHRAVVDCNSPLLAEFQRKPEFNF